MKPAPAAGQFGVKPDRRPIQSSTALRSKKPVSGSGRGKPRAKGETTARSGETAISARSAETLAKERESQPSRHGQINAFWECRIRGTAFQMPLPPCIETERLRLRPRRLNDIDAIVEMDLNPDVYGYRELGPETSMAIPDKTTLRNAVRSEILSSSPPEFWAVEWKDRQEFLGLAGLIAKPPRIRIAGLPNKSGTLFLAYRLAKGAWGQGVASEAADAILDFGFRTLDCQRVMALSHVDNIRSRRVLEKIAMRLVGKVLVQQESATSKQSNSETSKTAGIQPAVYLCYLLDREAYLLNR